MIDAYLIHFFILIGIYLILAMSLQLVLGYSGILNFGHIAFFGIGAYISAILSSNNVTFFISILTAGIISGFFGLLLSFITNRIKGDYLAFSTLGFSFVIYTFFLNWIEITKGPFGFPGIFRPNILGIDFSDNTYFLFLVIIFVLISYLFINRICSSPLGKALEATRDDEFTIKSLGKNTYKLKSISLIVSSFFAGVAGSLFAFYVTCIDPSSFTFINLIPILLIVIIGGLGSLMGTVLATIIVILLPEPLRFIGLPSSILGPMRQIIYALLLILIIHFKPRGFFGRIDLK